MKKPKTLKLSVKREIRKTLVKKKGFRFKQKVGHYYMVGRENGRILSRRRWHPKTFNKKRAVSIFKSNRTFNENIRRNRLLTKQYDQFEDTSKTPNKPQKYRFRYFFSGDIKGTKRTVGASSRTLNWESVAAAKSEAFLRFRRNIAFEFSQEYDEDEAVKFLNKVNNVEQGVRYEAAAS